MSESYQVHHWKCEKSHPIIGKPSVRPCLECGIISNVFYRSSMTAYHFEGDDEEDNPNRRWEGCEDCWEKYETFWQEQWDEYNSGRL